MVRARVSTAQFIDLLNAQCNFWNAKHIYNTDSHNVSNIYMYVHAKYFSSATLNQVRALQLMS
jgi:hypothetical protein